MAENKVVLDKDRLEDHGVLTSSGTNEFEMLSFVLDKCTYGVNVSKVREIVKYSKITSIPGSDDRILGVTMPRDELITVVDLRKCLNDVKTENNENKYFIICHFNNITVTFPIDEVIDIKRINWDDIISSDSIISTEKSSITGIVKVEDDIISILDLEKIMTEIDINNGLTVDDINNIPEKTITETKDRNIRVFVADDSKMLNKLICEAITKAGYEVTTFFNGLDLYNRLVSLKENNKLYEVDAVISDIEMPKMDGMRLCKQIKEDKDLCHIPVVMFSSLIDEMMAKKCESVGADAQFSKPEIGQVAAKIKDLVATNKKN